MHICIGQGGMEVWCSDIGYKTWYVKKADEAVVWNQIEKKKVVVIFMYLCKIM